MTQSYILFHSETSRYALELDKIERILMTPEETISVDNESIIDGMFNYEGSVIKIVSFRKMTKAKALEASLKEQFLELKEQHIEWIDALKDAIYNDKNFEKTKDPHACELGIWLDSFNSYNDEVMKTLKKLNYYHQALHKSANKVCELKNDKSEQSKYFEADVKELYSNTISNLDALINLLDDVANDSQKLLIMNDEDKKYALKVDKIDDIIHVDKSTLKNQSSVKKSSEFIDIAGVLEYKDILNSVVDTIKVSKLL
jgi:chemotaxis signal transduction protein